VTEADVISTIKEKLNTDINIPDGHKGALITYINNNRAELAIATKINEHWQVNLIGSHDWTGGNEVGFLSKVTW
jgi:hypothetical protein